MLGAQQKSLQVAKHVLHVQGRHFRDGDNCRSSSHVELQSPGGAAVIWLLLTLATAGGAGVEQDAQGDGSQAQFYASQPLPSLSAYRPSEDQLEKLTKHMERQAAMGELPWPLGAQGGLKGIVASHQVQTGPCC